MVAEHIFREIYNENQINYLLLKFDNVGNISLIF